MTTNAQKKARTEWNGKHSKQFNTKFYDSNPNDIKILKHMETVQHKQTWLKSALLAFIEGKTEQTATQAIEQYETTRDPETIYHWFTATQKEHQTITGPETWTCTDLLGETHSGLTEYGQAMERTRQETGKADMEQFASDMLASMERMKQSNKAEQLVEKQSILKRLQAVADELESLKQEQTAVRYVMTADGKAIPA